MDHLWFFKNKAWISLDFGPHLWPWPWIFMVTFWNTCISGMGRLINMKQKVLRVDAGLIMWLRHLNSPMTLTPGPWPWTLKVKFWNGLISGMGSLIDMKQKGNRSKWIGCWTMWLWLYNHTHELESLTLSFQGNFLKYPYVTNEGTGWYGRKGMRVDHSYHDCELGDHRLWMGGYI